MDSQEEQIRRLPLLREHDFRSPIPVIGPVIQLARRALYWLTAKWAVWVVIQQQNQINQMVEKWLYDHEALLHDQQALLVDLDKDLAQLARAVAEMEVRQRYLLQRLPSSATEDDD